MRIILFLSSLMVLTSASLLAQAISSTPQISLSQTAIAENRVLDNKATSKANDISYRIGIGDLLDVRVLNHPEMSRKTRVEGTGIIRVPYVGEVSATCLTESQLSQIITEKYRKYIREPNVDVFIEEYNSQPVAVMGAVSKPGRFQLQRRVRLIELLTIAGGPVQGQAGRTLHLIRSGEKDLCATNGPSPEVGTAAPESETAIPQLFSFNLKDLMTGSAEANLYVQPGDILTVPEAEQIFVTGYVMRPGPLPLNIKMTLTQALGMAGGYSPEASKKKVRLIRQAPNSNARDEQIINMEDIEKRKRDDIVLQANDIIEVPNSTGKVLLRGLLNTAPQGMVNTLPLGIIR